jgi:hypothetical protein
MGAGADGAGDFAHGHDVAHGLQSSQRATQFVVHQRELQAEGRRLGMNAVAAADARRELMFVRATGDDGPKLLHVGDEDVRALLHLHGVAGVPDVAAG